MIQVKEKWEIDVEIEVPGSVIKATYQSFDSMKAIAEFVEKETGTDKIQLYIGKDRANVKSRLGHLCLEGSCKLFAVEAKDGKRREAYLKM